MTTTTARLIAEVDADTDIDAAQPDISRSEPIGSTPMSLMNEALARVRIREASRGNLPGGARRPARVIAMLAAKRRERV
jgi:hypothetical protein